MHSCSLIDLKRVGCADWPNRASDNLSFRTYLSSGGRGLRRLAGKGSWVDVQKNHLEYVQTSVSLLDI